MASSTLTASKTTAANARSSAASQTNKPQSNQDKATDSNTLYGPNQQVELLHLQAEADALLLELQSTACAVQG